MNKKTLSVPAIICKVAAISSPAIAVFDATPPAYFVTRPVTHAPVISAAYELDQQVLNESLWSCQGLNVARQWPVFGDHIGRHDYAKAAVAVILKIQFCH